MMEIVKMQPSHVQMVADLEKISFSEPWSARSVASELENPLSFWLVCMDEERLLGYVGSQSVLDETDIMNIAVQPNARGKGIGRSLLKELIGCMKERGSRQISLEVRSTNAAAIHLYQSMGFQQVGLRRNYYRNPKEDAWILRKELME